MNKAVMGLAVLAVAAGGYFYWLQSHQAPANGVTPASAGDPAPVIRVEAVKVSVGRMAREIAAIGTLRSNESVIIRPEIAGRVAAIPFSEGQQVAKGQIMVKLDDTTYAAQLRRAEANLLLSEANSRRAEMLFAQGAGTERARDEAAAKLRADQAEIQLARAMLAKTVITAPFDGTAGLRKISVGAYVAPGQDIVNLESIHPIKVDFRIPEIFLASVRVGQTLAVLADAFPGRSFAGEVYAIDPLIDEAGRSILLRAIVDNADMVLRPGQFVRISLVVEETANALMVPEEALVPRGSEVLVYRVVDGKAQPVTVKIGNRRDGKAEILHGLVADDVVVTAGHMKLRPGAAVAVVDAKQGA